MVQRLHSAFNSQFSTEHPAIAIPQTPEALTPSTTNASNTSTCRSSQVPPREESQETPSLRSASRRAAEVTKAANMLVMPACDESNEQSTSPIVGAGPPVWCLSATPSLERDNTSGFRPDSPIPIQDLLGQMEPFDFDTFLHQDDTTEQKTPHSELHCYQQVCWNYTSDGVEPF